jgi:hypothetical protein
MASRHFGVLAKSAAEAIVPDLIVPVAVLANAVPRGRMFLAMCDNPVGEIRHSDEVGSSSRLQWLLF